MASSAAERHSPLLALMLVTAVLLLSSFSALAAAGGPSASAGPTAVAAGRARQDFHVATTPLHDAGVTKNGAGRRPVGGRRRRRADRGRVRGGGTGAWAFSGMLPRGFVPPSGSSACHNDMPATAADGQLYTCGSSVRP
ncbi:hypothetical protein CFC21_103496 [Triticum aestivum]|uniref:Uncharacterized protein n=2 Tax=Triticum aestivum TaxID=4565 RepID=A0A3B6SGU6_WHEAT|nr:uncharacterized protein LOC123162539 [Triticum aestivum]KAF7102339.1 hypothetical protein CFC21_103496 [Triticum aestivum]